MSNTVITIARQYGSGGRTVGKMLAKRLDIPCYDREIISLASEESGIHPTLFQDEKKKHGSLRAFLTGGFKNASPLSPESAGFTKDDNLFRYQAKIIRQLAEESSCVIIGRCADHILADVPQLIGELQAGGMDIVLPVFKVLDYDLVGGMDRERTGYIFREGVRHTPAVDHVLHAALQQGLGHHVGVHQDGNGLILVDKPVGIAAPDGFTHVFLCGKHHQ